jgi:hypothetical protein
MKILEKTQEGRERVLLFVCFLILGWKALWTGPPEASIVPDAS